MELNGEEAGDDSRRKDFRKKIAVAFNSNS